MANVDYDNGFVVGYAVGGSQTISSGGGGVPGGIPYVALSHTFVMGLVVPTYVTLVLKS